MTDLWLYQLLQVPALALIVIFLGLLFKGIERVLAARMQARIGPPVTQAFIDVRKLMMKENIVPRNAFRLMFNLMPVVALVSSLSIMLYIPFGSFNPVLDGHGDLILVLYLLIFPSLALVLGGMSSGSPFATVGAQREMVSMLSYEFPLAIATISIAWLVMISGPGIAGTEVFSLGVIASNPVWGLVGPFGLAGLVILFFVLVVVMPGKLAAAPFDVSKAKTELAGGALVEYSGRNLALFYIADAVKTIVFAALIISIFLPYGISGQLGLSGIPGMLVDNALYMAKLFIVVFAGSIFMRVAFARLRITQVVKGYWGYATLFALLGLVLISMDIFSRYFRGA